MRKEVEVTSVFLSAVSCYLNNAVWLAQPVRAHWWSWELRNPSRKTLASGFWHDVFIILSACLCMCACTRKSVGELSVLNRFAECDPYIFSISKTSVKRFSLQTTLPVHTQPLICFVNNVKASSRAHMHIVMWSQFSHSSTFPLSSPSSGQSPRFYEKKVQSCVTARNTKPHTGLPSWMTQTLLCAWIPAQMCVCPLIAVYNPISFIFVTAGG